MKKWFIPCLLYLLLINFVTIANAESIDAVCDVNYGLRLINQAQAPLATVQEILRVCDKVRPDNAQVLLLHGLLARKTGLPYHQFQDAITWLKRAKTAASSDNPIPALELALTYEWAGEFDNARPIYNELLVLTPDSRPALLGSARVAVNQKRWSDARAIYDSFLQQNSEDVDALNGLAWLHMANNDLDAAKKSFNDVLAVQDNNPEAIQGLAQIKEIEKQRSQQIQLFSAIPSFNNLITPQTPTCEANKGLALLSQTPLNTDSINAILKQCDVSAPNDVQTLLLHGLLARKYNDYPLAIEWLHKAAQAAATDDLTPKLELAVTYEWTQQLSAAQQWYEQVLQQQADNRPALLGLARIALSEKNLQKADEIYQNLLQKNANDSEAQQGLENLKNIQKQLATVIIPAQQCEANEALRLRELPNPPLNRIKKIVLHCEQYSPDDVPFLLLKGLLARDAQDFPTALRNLEKARSLASADNLSPALELAITYEWLKQTNNAYAIYTELLRTNHKLRPALLGIARIALIRNQSNKAQRIYKHFLQQNPNDLDAINGMGRVYLVTKNYTAAKQAFQRVLAAQATNADAQSGLEQTLLAIKFSTIKTPAIPVRFCHANKGLMLLNETNPPYDKIIRILAICDKEQPDDVQTLLLHGLLARKQALKTLDFELAIWWLQKAAANAPADNRSPIMELATTYEWAGYFVRARIIYEHLLCLKPESRPLLLAAARVALAQYRIKDACILYKLVLKQNPKDVEAITGLAQLKLINMEFKASRFLFQQSLQLNPDNQQAIAGLKLLKIATNNKLSLNASRYSVGTERSYGLNLDYYSFLNATDKFILQATHNSKEIQLGLILDPTILPKNSVLVGFQRQYPNRYGWGMSYEYRERRAMPVENRLSANANLYFTSNVQGFAGMRGGFPSPWQNQLYFSGLTLYTRYPFNLTATGFWAEEQFAGFTKAYAFDISKEFANLAFYNLGSTYSVTQRSWEVHGRIVIPFTTNQAFEALYVHYFFDGTTIGSLGWRLYW